MSNNKIFVSIAALEDPGLVKTIRDCIKKAKNPQNLVFGISLQYEVAPYLDEFINQCRIIKHDLPDYENNIGVGIIEIRNAIKQLHKDEDYFLQIDAHTEFEKNWDDILIQDINEFNDKVVISKHLVEASVEEDQISQFNFFHNRQNPEYPLIFCNPIFDTNLIQTRMINKNYFLNYYMPGGFIFAKSKWLYEVPLSRYHKQVHEELEQSLISHCFGYKVIAPLRKRQVIFKGLDSKNDKPLDLKWWNKGEDDSGNVIYSKKWITDSFDIISEVEKLLLFGKNDFMDITNNANDLISFYSKVGLGKDYKQYFAKLQNGSHDKNKFIEGHVEAESLLKERLSIIDSDNKGE